MFGSDTASEPGHRASQALVMGVVNVTPDSFFDGGRYFEATNAIAHGRRLFHEGADFVDVGGESTRPGAVAVDPAAEAARVVPVVEALAPLGRVSVDTTKADVARAAVGAGATLINDVSSSLVSVAAELGVGWVAMHRQGDSQTMQRAPRYDDVVAEVAEFLAQRVTEARDHGVDEIWVDPGIGFGKTVEHNLSLLRRLDVLTAGPVPVLVGTSRKAFLGRLTAEGKTEPPPSDRLEGSLVTATWAVERGAAMVRVHDVRATVRSIGVLAALQGAETEGAAA